jgi:hypothetical protein
MTMGVGEWIGAVGGSVGGVAGVAAVAVAVWSHRANERANRESRDVAERAVEVAADSAESARTSAMEATRVSRMEAEREHRALSPAEMSVRFKGERDRRTGLWSVFVLLETERCYRVRGEAVLDGNAFLPLGLPLVLHARTPTRVHIEELPDERESPKARQIVIRAWPPNAELDKVEAWTCPCGRPVEDGDGKVGHWQVELPVSYTRPPKPRVSFVG